MLRSKFNWLRMKELLLSDQSWKKGGPRRNSNRKSAEAIYQLTWVINIFHQLRNSFFFCLEFHKRWNREGKKLKIKKRFINSSRGKKQLRRRKNVSSYNLLHFFLLVKEKLVAGVVSKSQARIVEAGERKSPSNGSSFQMEHKQLSPNKNNVFKLKFIVSFKRTRGPGRSLLN